MIADISLAAQKSTILVCVSDNEHSRVAAKFAASKAKNTGSKLYILHVVNAADYQSALAVADVMREELLEASKTLLERFAGEAREWVGITPCVTTREGRITDEIINAIEEDNSINMLILGTSFDSPGREGILPWLVSQLGNRLLIPLTIVPGNLTEQQIKALT